LAAAQQADTPVLCMQGTPFILCSLFSWRSCRFVDAFKQNILEMELTNCYLAISNNAYNLAACYAEVVYTGYISAKF